jgi:type I restriction enzyme, S subunit
MPPRPEQARIVAELEAISTELDAATGALKRVEANLKRYRASVLKAACEGRLVPTEADLARKEGRTYETGEQLLARILKERRAKWEADQIAKMLAGGKPPSNDEWKRKYKEPAPADIRNLPKLPDGWTWGTWQQLSTRVTVGHVGAMKDEYVADGIPFLRSQNVRPNRFDAEGLLFISLAFDSKLEKSRLHGGDIAVVRSGSVGTACVVPDFLGNCNCADLVIIQRPIGIVASYGAYYMNSNAKHLIESGKVGVALIHFNTQSVAALPVPLPPLDEQDRIATEAAKRLSIADEVISEVELQIRRAARLRQVILKQSFEGKLVPQDPNDEPASVLLERIRAQRAANANIWSEPAGKRRSRRVIAAQKGQS